MKCTDTNTPLSSAAPSFCATRGPRSDHAFSAIVFLTVLSACSEKQPREEWEGSVDTLSTGTIRVTNPERGLWEPDSAWQLVPDLTLGELDGSGPTVFASISALEVDRHGRIYVLDRQANELRIFAPDGTHLRSVGRAGEGPGEYRGANGLTWLAPDSLVVVDQRGGRYSVLNVDGEFVRAVPRRLGFFGWVFSGRYHDGRVYEHFPIGRDTDRRPVLLGTAVAGPDAPLPTPTLAEGLGESTTAGTVDTVFVPEVKGPVTEPLRVRTERAGMVMGVPWAPDAVYHLDADGNLWFGHGSEFRVYQTSAGDTVKTIVLDATPAPITDAEVATWLDTEGVRRFREMGGRIDVSGLPGEKPFFTRLYVDPDGHLWATVPAGVAETVFAVFGADGRYWGRLRIDGLELDTFLAPVVRNGRLHVVGRDELDVQRVYRYVIQR